MRPSAQNHWRDLGVDVGCLLAPAAAVFAGGGTTVLGAALVFSLLILPGVLGTRLLLRPGHPWLVFPARLGVSAAIAFALFGTVSAVAAKLHWRFSGFLWTLAVVYVLVCAVLAVLMIRRRRTVDPTDEPWEPWQGMSDVHPAVALVVALCAIVTLAVVGGKSESWFWLSIALDAGIAALAVYIFARPKQSVVPPSRETDGRLASVLVVASWIGVALVAWYLMAAAFERKTVGMDDTTHVSRCADFLTGEPMDRFEPSLGHEIPMDPAYLLPTTSMLAATVAQPTGLSCAAQQRTVLPPMVLLVGIGAWIALLAVLLRGDRLLVPLATLILLGIFATSLDGMRSEAHAMFYRAMQPKSFHLLVMAPVQWGALLLVLRRPSARHTVLACLLAVGGHMITPWATVAGLVWIAACLATSLVGQRRAAAGLLVVLAVSLGLVGMYHLQAGEAPSAVEVSSTSTPDTPLELAVVNGEPLNRLDAGRTVGGYGLFRLGILAIPWVLLLGLRCREMTALVVASVATLCLAFAGPLADLQAELLPRSILWRTRWILPSAVNGTLLAIVLFESVRTLARRILGGAPALLVAAAVTLGALAWTGAGGGGARVERDGEVARWSKLDDATHELAELLASVDPQAYLLAEPRMPAYVPQLLPGVRLIMSRQLILEWFLGVDEATRRNDLIQSFYAGTMTPAEFRAMREEFPVEWVMIDPDRETSLVSRALLQKADWIRRATIRQYELWRAPSPATERFDIAPAVFRPTSTTATLHWSTSERSEVQVLCGSSLGDLAVCAETDESGPATVELTGLEPDADAWYRIRIRPPDGEWSEGVPQRFHTARPPGGEYRVALVADAHLQNSLRRPGSFTNLYTTIDAILADRPDFVVFLGDEPGVHYTRDAAGKVSQEEALARWRGWRVAYARLLESTPSFFVIGNHEGEAGFYREYLRAGEMEHLQRWGTIARKRYFPNPLPTTYPEGGEDDEWVGDQDSPATGGAEQGNLSPLENYFAWSWGDALFVVLDVHRYTRVGLNEPDSPDQWTLGPNQLQWLETTLRESDARWKFVLAHHVVGGWEYDLSGKKKPTDYAYGRGGARYARVGEQSRITDLMQQYGARIFFYGHDHVFAHQVAEGIDFVCNGRPTYLQTEWWDTPGWLEAYGGDGTSEEPPYYGAIGFTRLTVSPDEVQVEYVCTARDPQEGENVPVTPGEVLYSFTHLPRS